MLEVFSKAKVKRMTKSVIQTDRNCHYNCVIPQDIVCWFIDTTISCGMLFRHETCRSDSGKCVNWLTLILKVFNYDRNYYEMCRL